ncbi:MAG: methyltransferase domain-containing protein [Proteobacteria bacterium]|nr:methyltransferase domain-containing protein [Pseudomonadota bacterium]
MPTRDLALLRQASPSALHALCEGLRAASYDRPSVEAWRQRPAEERAEDDSPLATLIRLFTLGEGVSAGAFERAVAPTKPDDWAQLGCVAMRGRHVFAPLRLEPSEGLWLLSDRLGNGVARPGDRDSVEGVSTSSRLLANLTVRRPVAAALELATGCGYHALLAAGHTRQVLGVDANPRAVALAEINAVLNDRPSAQFIVGDFFEPAAEAGLEFDLIVSAVPLDVSPSEGVAAPEPGLEGDERCQQLLHSARDYLKVGGFCQLVCTWAEHGDTPWESRLGRWFEQTNCDAWVLACTTETPAAYARQRVARELGEVAARTRIDVWRAYYERLGITRLLSGLITLRRSERDRHWFRADTPPLQVQGGGGESIALGFELRDFVEDLRQPEMLLDIPMRLSPHARLRQEMAPGRRGWESVTSELRFERGLAFEERVGSDLGQVLGNCDGVRVLRAPLAQAARARGADPARELAAAVPTLVRLVERGFLIPEPIHRQRLV